MGGNIAMQQAATTFTPKTEFYRNRFPTMGAKSFMNHLERKSQRAWGLNKPTLAKKLRTWKN